MALWSDVSIPFTGKGAGSFLLCCLDVSMVVPMDGTQEKWYAFVKPQVFYLLRFPGHAVFQQMGRRGQTHLVPLLLVSFSGERPQGAMFNPALVRAEIRLSISEILMQQKDRISRHSVREGENLY